MPLPKPDARRWGVTCQLYGLRSTSNWGIGDFSDLSSLVDTAGSYGAATCGINPLHALFAAEPLHISPYAPSRRRYLDYLYIA
jgi:4-alpha-glucanotransferase